ncbi:phosphate ABC transporter substrate-binding protein PstS [Dokdonella sp.]|uniref:phosphate ABC transporter substrate-binding protein PstS n=1 Tax=Dokdonella sp. TaxID=2291710 RepID=UPI003C6EDE1F
MSISIKLSAAVFGVATVFAASGAHASEVTGAGSSFVFPLMSKWSADYNVATKNQVNYQSIGSSGGIAQIKAATVDFGASDKPLPSAEVAEAGLVQFPIVIGGVVPVVNVAGVEPGKLKLTGSLLADIFLGKVTKWNDPAIMAINNGMSLPEGKITIVHRSDGSGTTYNFVNYLSKVSPEWKEKVGEGTSVQWPVGLGGKGNEGVAAYVKQVKNSIGYVELSYALQNKMSYTQMENAAGKYVQPSAESFAAAAASADWKNATDFSLVITNAPGDESWPISATVFVLMHAQAKDAERAKAAREFFSWGYANGKSQAASLDYVPLPDSLVEQIKAYWTARIK